MAERISKEAAAVIGFSEAVKKTASDISKAVVEFNPDKVRKGHWDLVITNLDQIVDLVKRAKSEAIEARGQCQPELDLKVTGGERPRKQAAND